MMQDWRPTASIENIRQRAQLLAAVREYFRQQNVLEVETPLLCRHTVTEPHIDSISIGTHQEKRYLQTSPEYAMKRLLAAGVPDCYQICKAFRQSENGSRHNTEFSLLEWYRLGFNLEQIIQDTLSLIETLCGKSLPVKIIAYRDAIQQVFERELNDLDQTFLVQQAQSIGVVDAHKLSYEQCLDIVFSEYVMPQLQHEGLTVIHGYPAAQAALAQLNPENSDIADRFEVFYQNLECANGYVELTNAHQQAQRFELDQQRRTQYALPEVETDQRLLAALESGLPHCAGVALGLDRLLMLVCDADHIANVISFDWPHA
jgi:lysyl-tRNA synthetase class 2